MKQMTGREHDRFMNMIARFIGTKRQYISLDKITPMSDGKDDVRVIYRGGFVYRLIISGGIILTAYREVKRA